MQISLSFEAIYVAVAPVVVTILMAVKGKPEITGTASHIDRNNASPSVEASVGIVETCTVHAVFAVYTIVGHSIEVIAAHKKQDTAPLNTGKDFRLL